MNLEPINGFEKMGVKSALVKPENLRIAFMLPSEG